MIVDDAPASTDTTYSGLTHVAIIGLGYVGLPLAVAFAESGLQVTGFDVSCARVEELRAGRSHVEGLSSSQLRHYLDSGRLRVTGDQTALSAADAILICVPTPLRATRDPDLSMIDDAVQRVQSILRAGQLVVLESTTFPGTTDERVLPVLERSGLAVGRDFFVGYSPERIDPGSTSSSGYTLRSTPKVVGGVTPACLERTAALYRLIADSVIPCSSPRVAEMAKLYENIFRVVNVAMANEMALLCDRMGVDVWEVLDVAGTKPFGFMKFLPGPGVGGHCIPVDPFYLTWKAKEFAFNTRFIELAGEINLAMPYHVVQLAQRALNMRRKSVAGAAVLILGAAYKRDISDVRESPALKIISLLQQAGADVSYHDPHVPVLETGGQGTHRVVLRSSGLTQSALEATDCVVLVTDHSSLDLNFVLQHADLVVDTRNATRNCAQGKATIVTL